MVSLKWIILETNARAENIETYFRTKGTSWLNCALRGDKAVYLVVLSQYATVIDVPGSVEGIYAFIY